MQIKNPELLRYVRSELRPGKVWATVAGVLVALVLIILNGENKSPTLLWSGVHETLLLLSGFVLVFWCVIVSAQSLVAERSSKSFDLWRTTRTTEGEAILGRLFGPALLPWLQYLLCLPLLLATAAPGHIRHATLFKSYGLIALYASALSLIALCVSARAQDPRQAQFLAFLTLVPAWLTSLGVAYAGTSTAKLESLLVPLRVVFAWYEGDKLSASWFGHPVSAGGATALLYALIAGWAIWILRGVIRREPEQVALLTPRSSILLSITVVTIGCAFFFAPLIPDTDAAQHFYWRTANPAESHLSALRSDLSWMMIALYLSHLLSVSGVRRYSRGPQQVRSSIAGALMTRLLSTVLCGAVVLTHLFRTTGVAARADSTAVCILAALFLRDAMFLHWMVARTARYPLVKGLGILTTVYCFGLVLVGTHTNARALVLPFASDPTAWMIAGCMTQMALALVFLALLSARLFRNHFFMSEATAG